MQIVKTGKWKKGNEIMIIKLSVVGTMANDETRTASVSIKGRVFKNEDCELLYEKVKQIIEINKSAFQEIRVCLEMKKRQKAKAYKAKVVYDKNLENANILEGVMWLVMVMDYEMAVGKFKACSL